MELEFSGEIWWWKGPAPFHFVTVPPGPAEALRQIAPVASYGWGVIPVTGQVGATTFTTSLFPKDGGYLVPLKDVVREAEGLAVGDRVTIRLTVDI
jgi:hypothetical protein